MAINNVALESLKYRWVVMGVWFTSAVTGFMVASTLGILLPSISEEFGLSPSQQGMLGSSAFFGNLLLAIPLSWWTSRYGPKILTAVTLTLGTLFIFVQGVAPAFFVLVIGRMGFGITILAREPARAHLLRQWFSPHEVVIANSISNMLFGIIVGGGLVITPILLNNVGLDWRTTYYVFGAIFIMFTVLWIVLGREREVPPQVERTEQAEQVPHNLLVSAFRYRDLWVAGLGFTGATFTWSAFLSFYPTLMLSEYDVSLKWSGAVLALGVLMGGVSGMAMARYISANGGRRFVLVVFGILMASTYFGMVMVDSIPMLILLNVLNGIAWGFFPILYSVPFTLPGIRVREAAIGVSLIAVCMSLGSASGPLAAGFLQEALGDLRIALVILSVTGLSLSLAGIFLRPEGSRVITQATEPASA